MSYILSFFEQTSFGFLWIFAGGTALFVAALAFQRSNLSRSLHPLVQGSVFTFVLAFLVGPLAYEWWSRPLPERAPTSGPTMMGGGSPDSLARAQNTRALKIGDPLPPLKVEGWIHADAKGPETKGKIVVLDIWAMWCPFCKSTAPHLVKLSKKYQNQDVVFLSLTNLGETSTRPFLENQSMDWSSAYGADLESLARLGAFNEEVKIPGYEVKPTLMIINRAGNIVWTDNHARYRHQEPEVTSRELDLAIEKALAEPKE